MLPRHFSTSSSNAMTPALHPRELVGVILAGIVIYLITFAFIVAKPITLGEAGRYSESKAHYLATLRGQRKIAIFAGSNGRYSHRCETVAKVTGIPCANLSTAAGSDLDWMMSPYWRYLEKGDVLYMPLEYWPLLAPGARVGNEAPYVVRHEHAWLRMYPPSRLPFALFYFDIRYLISGIGEMLLARSGYERRTSVLTMTTEGDERGVTSEKAIPYRSFIDDLPTRVVSLDEYDNAEAVTALDAVIDRARSNGVIVVGGLPTIFDDAIVPAAVINRLRDLYEGRGACFLVLPNLSKYPRSDFFDTAYHLQETFQIAHSTALAPRLAEISRTSLCPEAAR
jgi:hypothetical protein